MKFAINGTQDVREISIKEWTGDNWGPDCFQDLECNFPQGHDVLEDSGLVICTEQEYLDLVHFWEEEVSHMNSREVGECGDYSELICGEMVVITAGR